MFKEFKEFALKGNVIDLGWVGGLCELAALFLFTAISQARNPRLSPR